MKHLAADLVRRPPPALPGVAPLRASKALIWHTLDKLDDAQHLNKQLNHDVPDEFAPGVPPVEPDEGPVPARVPDDAEHDRVVDPAANLDLQAQFIPYQLEAARCP